MASAFETNVDLLLIENKQLQDSARSLSQQLAKANTKYNSILSVLQTQYAFMHDIELRMNILMKRDKPLKEDLKRIRAERNHLREESKMLGNEKKELKEERERLEKENVWLLQQIELSRKVGKDMESLVAARINLEKAASGPEKASSSNTDRLRKLQQEKSRLDVENQSLSAKVGRLEQELKRSTSTIEELRRQVSKEQAKCELVKGECSEIKQQLVQVLAKRSSEDEKNALQLHFLKEQISNLDSAGVQTVNTNFVASPAFKNNAQPSPTLNDDGQDKENSFSENKVPQQTMNSFPSSAPIAPASKSDFLNAAAQRLIEAKRTASPLRRRSPSPSNPFFPSSSNPKRPVALHLETVIETGQTSTNSTTNPDISVASPEKSTFVEQPTFLIQEALESRRAMESLVSSFINLIEK